MKILKYFSKHIKKLLILVLFLLNLFNTNCSQSTDPGNDVEPKISSLQQNPQFSSDGQEIVFDGLYDSIYAVHFVDTSGNYLGYILNNQGHLNSPTWSPDNKKIAVSIEGNIYTVHTNGDKYCRRFFL